MTTLIIETTNGDDCSVAERVLRSVGYGVTRHPGGPRVLRVQVVPGERPQAALRAAGLEFRLRQMDGPR